MRYPPTRKALRMAIDYTGNGLNSAYAP